MKATLAAFMFSLFLSLPTHAKTYCGLLTQGRFTDGRPGVTLFHEDGYWEYELDSMAGSSMLPRNPRCQVCIEGEVYHSRFGAGFRSIESINVRPGTSCD